ncbi:NADH-quinone oxidoreductase subunit J [Paenibacillus chitinolyticus]|uniref:NADH-quinone oxidoreductase subunit J n=1 Tax=Paenibacillus chitinolyticus TaxID=79263 RepID=A0A410WQK3_9BACL|nr:NADH-quinone oxidoreductase subunit J [Paenibacillus chitinolyticus]MCY9591732.1 NADH-quinone oxidoreductase subunit J [Paenibacillus chitinolyticus]MCY9596091.1 NADH-quinone oxidoreductase subunit J [Paenibacillus chitinolyticus]QAV16621.1 NADH-quinone oxidoreductase subunit J [Paenibacillus chitinolyticus]GKS14210.1 NADH:ubiquinone oxidoreductase subunit J [Paenibacillus chitinolyticus]
MFSGLGSFLSQGENWWFLLFAICAIGGAIYMITFTKVVHMVLSVAFTFVSLAGLYVLLEAEFVGFVQILIYAGAISILMIFGIMMTNHRAEEKAKSGPVQKILLGVGSLGLFGILFYAIQNTTFPSAAGSLQTGQDNTLEIGKLLYNEYVIPFEIMSVLLTVAFIGAIVVAKREED